MNPSPNFLIIGAQKSGTTSLYEYLKQHPDVLMSNKKETEFLAYDKFYLKGFNYYEKFFSGYKGQKCVGEASTDYSNYVGLEKTIKRIYDFNKNMKLIYILRTSTRIGGNSEKYYSSYGSFQLQKNGIIL